MKSELLTRAGISVVSRLNKIPAASGINGERDPERGVPHSCPLDTIFLFVYPIKTIVILYSRD
jgi:hypothetical protein